MESSVAEHGETVDHGYTVYPTYKLWIHTENGSAELRFRWNNRYVADFNINGMTAEDIKNGHNGLIYTQVYPEGEKDQDFSQNEKYDIPNFHAVTYSLEESVDARNWAYDINACFGLAYIAEAIALAVTYAVMVARKFKEPKE